MKTKNTAAWKKDDSFSRSFLPHSVKEAFAKAFKQSLRVSWTLIKVYIPLALVTTFLKQIGVLDFIAPYLSPFMKFMGLPGEAAITLLVAFTNNVYASIGTMAPLQLTFRQVTILGVMIGLAHTLFIETAVLMKLKMGTLRIAFFRIGLAIFAGVLMNLLLPQNVDGVVLNPYTAAKAFSWLNTLKGMGITCGQIIVYMFIIMLCYEFVMLWKAPKKVQSALHAVPKAIGMSEQAFGPWIVGFFIGITYGAGILFQFAEKHKLSHRDVCLTTIFLVLAHAIIEDTMAFTVLGGNFWYIILIRVFTAFIVTRVLATKNLYRYFLWIGLPKEKTLLPKK